MITFQFDNMTVEQISQFVKGNAYTTFMIDGELVGTEALWLKKTLTEMPQLQYVTLDLRNVVKTDLLAANALVIAHRRHFLTVEYPTLSSACEIFEITHVPRILEKLSPFPSISYA